MTVPGLLQGLLYPLLLCWCQCCTAKTENLTENEFLGFLHSWLENLHHHPKSITAEIQSSLYIYLLQAEGALAIKFLAPVKSHRTLCLYLKATNLKLHSIYRWQKGGVSSQGLWSQNVWVGTSGQCVPRFPHLSNGNHDSTYLLELWFELNDWMCRRACDRDCHIVSTK